MNFIVLEEHDKFAVTLHMSVFNPEHTLHPPGHAVHMSDSLLPMSHTKLNLFESESHMNGHLSTNFSASCHSALIIL